MHLALTGIRFDYGRGDFVLTVPSLEVAHGETVAVIGPSGSGKTTLLHLVAGIAVPKAGTIQADDVQVNTLSDAERRAFRITRLGLVFQEFELLDHLDVIDNILLPYRLTPALELDAEARDRARDLADRVSIADKLSRNVRQLSQGERQRVAIARALVTEAPFLLADEPTGNLDPKNKDIVLDVLLDAVTATGASLLAVTHDHACLDRFGRTIDVATFHAEEALA